MVQPGGGSGTCEVDQGLGVAVTPGLLDETLLD